MPLTDLIASPVTGVRAFNGLPVDALLWNEAHNQHHLHRRIHALTAHRPGIVYGLEVIARGGQGVMVAPGVGVDSDGQIIILSEPTALTFKERGQCYIALSYQPMLSAESVVSIDGGEDHFRLIEARELVVTKELPGGPFLELARIARSGTDKPVREPVNPFDPEQDELNLLHRKIAFPHCYAEAAIGEIGYVPASEGDPNAWKPNRAGVWNLTREGNGRGFYLEFLGPVTLARDSSPGSAEPTLLYMAGRSGFTPLSDAETERLSRLITGGATLLGEAAGGSAEFLKAFGQLAGRLSATLRPLGKGHALLTAHHVFTAPPPGGQTTGQLTISDDGGVILSTYDYGAAWQGAVGGISDSDTQARERIRQAQEFGLNIIAHASRRRRLTELARIR